MKRLLPIAALALAAYLGLAPAPGHSDRPAGSGPAVAETRPTVIDQAFAGRRSNLQVEGRGTVQRLLADDNTGSRHQRFIVRLDSGLTVLVAHNIDLAPRLDALRAGDAIAFAGEYEWSSKGGVIHWTHQDPQGRHPGGWLRHAGRIYE
jgi:hypothetical protein